MHHALFYLGRVKFILEEKRAIPVISCWDDVTVWKRQKNEIAAGGFGLGRVLGHLKIKHTTNQECSTNPFALALLLPPPSTGHSDKRKVHTNAFFSSLL